MPVERKKRIWLTSIAIFCTILLILAGISYYTIVLRFKDTLRFIVNKESNGLYTFNATQIELSLLKRQIKINNASLICKDTASASAHYNLRIPDIFLSVQSISEMLLHRKFSIDSIAIAMPQLSIHEHTRKNGKHTAFHVSNVFEILQNLKSHLNIRSFSIHTASFDYENIHNPYPFRSNRISLFVKNFSKGNNSDQKFFSSDDIDLSILNQHWKLPDGLHEVSFTNLHFSGGNQFFELDSCMLRGKDRQHNIFSISAQKLFFNSKQLTAFYDKEALLLDTLLLYKPNIYLEISRKEKKRDSTHKISETFRHLFNVINLKYVDIVDGDIELIEKNTKKHLFISKGSNFKVYDLILNKDSTSIRVDSITLKQKNISFITKDSLYRLNIKKFSVESRALFLKDVVYEPTEKNSNAQAFTFKSPLLKLSGIDIDDLLEKKLNASLAELYEPQIDFKIKKSKRKHNHSKYNEGDHKLYHALHGLNELLFVKQLYIINGSFNFQSTGTSVANIHVKKINSLILPERFFSSDSLIDIKRSLPKLSIGKITVKSSTIHLNAAGYLFEGERRYNRLSRLDLTHGKKTSIKGKDISWSIFDWDKYRNHKIIDINTIHIKELSVATGIGKEKMQQTNLSKDFPVIHLDRIDIDKIGFSHTDAAGGVVANGAQICVDNINSLKHGFTWGNIEGLFSDLAIKRKDVKINIRDVTLNTQSQTAVNNLDIEMVKNDMKAKISVPGISMDLQVHSSDLSCLHFVSLFAQRPSVEIHKIGPAYKNAQTATAGIAVKPEAFPEISIDKLEVEKARVSFFGLASDSTKMEAKLNIKACNISQSGRANSLFSWKTFGISLVSTDIRKAKLQLIIPSVNMLLSEGNIKKNHNSVAINSRLSANWNDAFISLTRKSNSRFTLKDISGNIKEHLISFSTKENLPWNNISAYLSFHSAALLYETGKSVISAANINYEGPSRDFSVEIFKLTPNDASGTAFKTNGEQKGYTEFQLGCQVKGIVPGFDTGDSVFRARKVIVSDLKLNTVKGNTQPLKQALRKPMLTEMINNLEIPIAIDSIILRNGNINVYETTAKLHKEVNIPLEHVNAVVTNVKNRDNAEDSLFLEASLDMFNTRLNSFRYSESYGDSLSSFKLRIGLSPGMLRSVSYITMPYANINIIAGRIDTAFAWWAGNKYAAAGRMNFIYDGLKIKVMSPKNAGRSTLLGKIESFLANDIALHRRNKQPAIVFFVRDQEKSVFNFWVKTKLSGIIASAVIFQRNKNYKEYLKYKEIYKLTDIDH
ncbi:hypothetical protein DC498_06240 [Terrimonas sp.]|uniref:hypothetical protein n=1 Tax=Terrimonas sp. TaxID=1914338 RepID=UPI000D508B74|nr:hypothetical protein [Terrimonas sp.]PVD52964.1 hypothetical protein DC498_06240 [Terrimonas sp.]